MKHENVALFVPHVGCPHMCSFCNQRVITGRQEIPCPDDVDAAAETAKNSPRHVKGEGEIAFFGGSFTAVDRRLMISLLKAAHRHIESGDFKGIRISTRPDAIDGEILDILQKYGVTAIELGAQSMVDEVLCANERGHTADDVRRASRLIKARGFELGLQMMTGLYNSSDERDIFTARALCELHPDTVRIYPTAVLKGTALAEKLQSGEYIPQSVEDAVPLCAELLKIFNGAGVCVIRVGLHDSDSLRRDLLAGAFHPAFRELCEGEMFYNAALELLKQRGAGDYIIEVDPRDISKMTGQSKKNIKRLSALGYNCRVRGADNVKKGRMVIRESDHKVI